MCHKIGTNFTPSAKGFYIDTDSRVIKYKAMDSGDAKTDILGQSNDGAATLIEPADE